MNRSPSTIPHASRVTRSRSAPALVGAGRSSMPRPFFFCLLYGWLWLSRLLSVGHKQRCAVRFFASFFFVPLSFPSRDPTYWFVDFLPPGPIGRVGFFRARAFCAHGARRHRDRRRPKKREAQGRRSGIPRPACRLRARETRTEKRRASIGCWPASAAPLKGGRRVPKEAAGRQPPRLTRGKQKKTHNVVDEKGRLSEKKRACGAPFGLRARTRPTTLFFFPFFPPGFFHEKDCHQRKHRTVAPATKKKLY